jgi:NADP-dependent 3-hydroxy acid dehydrogenase YdfG
MDFADKVFAITGASAGMGAGPARRLAAVRADLLLPAYCRERIAEGCYVIRLEGHSAFVEGPHLRT